MLLPCLWISCGGGGGRDSIAPAVNITSPSDGEIIWGTIKIRVTATDNSGKVARVEFFVSGQKIGEVSIAPFELDWDTLQGTNGTHTLTVKAWDPSGNWAEVSINVNVQNDITPPETFIDSGPPTRTKEQSAT
ncbi:MAG: Ig-like domain-containing protein, partial [bacterium]